MTLEPLLWLRCFIGQMSFVLIVEGLGVLGVEWWSQDSGSSVIPRRARPGLAGLGLHT